MGSLTVEIDATGSAVGGGNPDGTAYALSTANGYALLSFDAPEPEQDIQWASSADTEGETVANQRYRNRVVTARYRLAKSSDALLEAELNALGKKVGKLVREGGTLKVTVPSGTVCYLDVVNASQAFAWDQRFLRIQRGEITLTLPCKPFIRTAEVELGSDTTETTLPYLVKTVTGPAGDVTALGRLLVDNDQAVDQWWLTWGLESRYYSNSANAALFYEAEGRTAMGGSATAAGPSGASGGGSNVMRNTALPLDYLAILSTQATGGGAHLSHIGTFRAYARVQVPTSNTGNVSVALEWAEADFLRYTRNTATTIPTEHEGQWRLVDLGLVSPTKVTAGTQRWEGRVVAKSTVSGDDIDIDYLLLVPVTEGSGIVSGVNRPFTPTAYVAEDRFTSTTAGNALNARSAPTGGTWATSGDATDFAFSDDLASETIKRSAASGTNGRFAVLGSTNYGGAVVSTTVSMEAGATVPGAPQAGVIARWTDSSNHLRAVIYRHSSAPILTYLEIHEVLGGTKTVVAQATSSSITPFQATAWKVELAVDTAGRAVARMIAFGASGLDTGPMTTGTVALEAEATVASAVTGGTLATGKPGIFDLQTSATTGFDRYYDDFLVASIPPDAAVFASQSIELRHDRVIREDSGGAMWTKPTSYLGDYLLLPPTGAEGRSIRVIAKFSRSDPFANDPNIDDLSARLFATPRFLAIPD